MGIKGKEEIEILVACQIKAHCIYWNFVCVACEIVRRNRLWYMVRWPTYQRVLRPFIITYCGTGTCSLEFGRPTFQS